MKRIDIKKKKNKRTLFFLQQQYVENSRRLSKGNIISNDIFIYVCPMFQENTRKVLKYA